MTVDEILEMYRTTYNFSKQTGMSYACVKIGRSLDIFQWLREED